VDADRQIARAGRELDAEAWHLGFELALPIRSKYPALLVPLRSRHGLGLVEHAPRARGLSELLITSRYVEELPGRGLDTLGGLEFGERLREFALLEERAGFIEESGGRSLIRRRNIGRERGAREKKGK